MIEIGDQGADINPEHLGKASREGHTGATLPADDHPDVAPGNAEGPGDLAEPKPVDVSPVPDSSRRNDEEGDICRPPARRLRHPIGRIRLDFTACQWLVVGLFEIMPA